MQTLSYNILHYIEKDEKTNTDKHDFDLSALPDNVFMPLINVLKWEQQKRSLAASDRSFREERAIIHQRALDNAKKTGTVPQQQFIDFPLT